MSRQVEKQGNAIYTQREQGIHLNRPDWCGYQQQGYWGHIVSKGWGRDIGALDKMQIKPPETMTTVGRPELLVGLTDETPRERPEPEDRKQWWHKQEAWEQQKAKKQHQWAQDSSKKPKVTLGSNRWQCLSTASQRPMTEHSGVQKQTNWYRQLMYSKVQSCSMETVSFSKDR